jgi:hypothetical protein
MREGEEVVAPFFLRDLIGGRLVMVRQVAHSADRHLLGLLGQAAALAILDHALAQWGHGSTSCPGGVMDSDVQEVESLSAV